MMKGVPKNRAAPNIALLDTASAIMPMPTTAPATMLSAASVERAGAKSIGMRAGGIALADGTTHNAAIST